MFCLAGKNRLREAAISDCGRCVLSKLYYAVFERFYKVLCAVKNKQNKKR